MRILLHCLHSFLVAAGQFSDGCSSDVLLVLYMAVHVCDYSVDSEIQMNEDIMEHLLVEMIHAHLGLLGHLAPIIKMFKKINNVITKQL